MAKAIRMPSKLAALLGKYSLKSEAILGVDISPHYVRIGQMALEHGAPGLKMLASSCMESMYTKNDVISNMDAYVAELRGLIAEGEIKTKYAAVALPVGGSIIRTATIPSMSESDIDQASHMGGFWENTLGLGENLSSFSSFYHILSKDTEYNTMDVLFCATPQQELGIYTEIVKRAGLIPVVADTRCFALYSAFIANSPKTKEPILFIEFGPDDNYVFIAEHNKFTLQDIFIGNDDKALLLAEDIDDVAVGTFVQNYSEQLRQIISAYDSTAMEGKRIRRIYVSSTLPLHVNNPSASPLIVRFVAKMREIMEGYNIEECNFCDHTWVPERFAPTVNAEGKLSAWALTIGMGLHKLDAFDVFNRDEKRLLHINLMPDVMPYKKAERIRIGSTAVMAGVMVAGVGMFVLSFIGQALHKSQIMEKLAKMSQVEKLYKKEEEELKELKTVSGKLQELDTIRKTLPSNQKLLVAVYLYVSDVIPMGVWIKEMSFTAPTRIEIIGNSVDDQSILEFVKLLNSTTLFSKISLMTMEAVKPENEASKRAGLLKQFTLTGQVNIKAVITEEKDEEEDSATPENTTSVMPEIPMEPVAVPTQEPAPTIEPPVEEEKAPQMPQPVKEEKRETPPAAPARVPSDEHSVVAPEGETVTLSVETLWIDSNDEASFLYGQVDSMAMEGSPRDTASPLVSAVATFANRMEEVRTRLSAEKPVPVAAVPFPQEIMISERPVSTISEEAEVALASTPLSLTHVEVIEEPQPPKHIASPLHHPIQVVFKPSLPDAFIKMKTMSAIPVLRSSLSYVVHPAEILPRDMEEEVGAMAYLPVAEQGATYVTPVESSVNGEGGDDSFEKVRKLVEGLSWQRQQALPEKNAKIHAPSVTTEILGELVPELPHAPIVTESEGPLPQYQKNEEVPPLSYNRTFYEIEADNPSLLVEENAQGGVHDS
ncbi:MAG: Fimbrial assembly family protein [Rickettsiales bacterium]|jgi:hypothetical protein|nr:Fimbrial assembly family protein [Rickettsiales bacterium]